MFSLRPLVLGKTISGIAEETAAAQTGAVEEMEDLGEEKTSKALTSVLETIDFQLLTRQALSTKAEEQQQLMMRITKNVKLSRTTWRSGRARDNGAFPLILLRRILFLDLQTSLLKSYGWNITPQEHLGTCRAISMVLINCSTTGEVEFKN